MKKYKDTIIQWLFYDLQRYNPYTRDMRHSLRIALENVGYRLENGEKA